MTAGGGGFDGFCIGGSFDKDDIYKAVEWVTDILPEEKPRHLLGMGEVIDLFEGVERGIDTFDCVSPTRLARNGALYTRKGRINILNAEYTKDFSPIDLRMPLSYLHKLFPRLYRASFQVKGNSRFCFGQPAQPLLYRQLGQGNACEYTRWDIFAVQKGIS